MQDFQKQYAAQIQDLTDAANRMAQLGYVTSHGGNLSYRVADNVVLITPTKVEKRKLTFEDIVAVDLQGRTVFAGPGRKPTGETPIHTRLLRNRPDLNCLVHAHPPVLTGFSMSDCKRYLSRPLLPEVVIEVGPILDVPYAEPISEELAEQFDKVIGLSNAWLMLNHGVVVGSSEGIERAADFMQMIEQMAVGVHVAATVGQVTEISREEVANLEKTLATRNMPRPGDPRKIKSLLELYDWE